MPQRAGLSITEADFTSFVAAFEQVCSELLSESESGTAHRNRCALDNAEMNLDVARSLDAQVLGAGLSRSAIQR